MSLREHCVDEPRIYRASSLGYSLERLVAPFLGFEALPTPDWLLEKFQDGTDLEPQVVAELENLGWTVSTTQPEINSEGNHQLEVTLDVIPGVATVRGHLDGVGIEPPARPARVVEVKSMGEKSVKEASRLGWETPGLIQKYKWQLSCYMLATGLEGVLVVCSKGKGGVKNLLYMYADQPFYTISDIANKLQQAEDYIRDGIIPEGCTDYPCPYAYLHSVEEPPEQADTELDGLLAAWLEADKHEKVYKSEKAVLKEAIVEYVGGEGKGKVKGSQGVLVSVNWVEEKEVNYKTKGHWETRINPPRKGRKGD